MDWLTVPISDFCQTGSVRNPSISRRDIPGLKSGELRRDLITKTEEYITEEALSESRARVVPAGSILIGMFGPAAGQMSILGIDAAINQAICYLIPNPKVALTKYVFYALRLKVPQMLAKSVGVTLTKINQKTLKETLIPLPPLSEQGRIVEIVERAEALGKKRSELDTKVDSILSALFIKMFGDPATNPMKWDVVELGELLKTSLRTGLRVGKENYVDRNSESGIEIVRVADLRGEMIERGNLTRVALTEREIGRYLVNEDNLLMSRMARTDKAATPFRVPSSPETLVFDSSVIRIDLNLETIKPLYLYYYLVNPRTRMPYFHRGAIVYTLQLKSLENIVVLLPPLEKQNNFIDLVTKIDKIRHRQITSKNKLEALFKNILHRAFAGELTARWRESHEKELLAEMEEQAKLLSLSTPQSNQ